MTTDLEDLLPLFLSEAVERLEKIEVLLDPDIDADLHKSAKRELHTLKGAGRMMGLAEIADLCHQAENLLGSELRLKAAGLAPVLTEIRHQIEGLQGGIQAPPKSEPGIRKEAPTESLGPPPSDIRMPNNTLDTLSDEGARMRVLATGAAALMDRLHGLALIAENAVFSPQPQQALASVAVKLRHLALETERAQRRFDGLVEGHLQQLLGLQVQSVRPFLQGLARHARELAQSLGKTIEVQVDASDSRLDRRTMEAIREGLLHLVRNAVDHGLEADDSRRGVGKGIPGTIVLATVSTGDRIRIRVSDDGRGIDPVAVVRKAIELGFISSAVADDLSREAILQLLFISGLSTREEATKISGRGIGLDAVAETVRNVGGEVWIDSDVGKGTTITLDLPVAQRGERIVVIDVGGMLVAVPAAIVKNIQSFSRLDGDLGNSPQSNVETIDLARIFGIADSRPQLTISVRAGGLQALLVADRIVSEEEVFVRPFPFLARVGPELEGMALLGNGRPVPVIDVQKIAIGSWSGLPAAAAKTDLRPRLSVLLVDDSRVTREMLRRLFADADLSVTAVGTGEAALRALEEQHFDCLVTDIEMPGMSGLDLCRAVRGDSRRTHLPIVVVSTLGSAGDRLAGLDAGADAYVTKQNVIPEELIDLVQRLGGGG